jgi:quinol monooxygenase YgiN
LWVVPESRVVETEEFLGTGFHAVHVIPIAGFLDRPNTSAHDTSFISITKVTANPGNRRQIIETLRCYVSRVESNSEVLSFLVLEAIDDEDTLFVWERYSSERVVRRVHQKRDGFVKLWATMSPIIKRKTNSGYIESCGFIDKSTSIP